MVHSCISCPVFQILPLQLLYVILEQNQLTGTLPDSWSNLANVSHWYLTTYIGLSMLPFYSLARPPTTEYVLYLPSQVNAVAC